MIPSLTSLPKPYDTGFFFSRRLSTGTTVFQNPGAPYLSAHASSIPSPLNIGLENSRRFRALPVYATLLAYGRSGYRGMLERQILLSRTISEYMLRSEKYELLPARGGEDGQGVVGVEERLQEMFIIVIFRAKDVERNKELVSRINGTRKVYVSGTMWDGRPAARFAVRSTSPLFCGNSSQLTSNPRCPTGRLMWRVTGRSFEKCLKKSHGNAFYAVLQIQVQDGHKRYGTDVLCSPLFF